jgi:diaminohydroxyphosphoribosylaminopyrimidine deaminase/5-amino-6-(5-phosphoribosylamino)uracil reductase
MIMTSDEHFMQRALELAKLGVGCVSLNPLVGCVIVCDGAIIGEGWHKKYGEAHAEVSAVNSVRDKAVLKNSTAYVSLVRILVKLHRAQICWFSTALKKW